jgi:hypothetical protein
MLASILNDFNLIETLREKENKVKDKIKAISEKFKKKKSMI